MKGRANIGRVILGAVYLLWICGHAVIDVSCHFERTAIHATYHASHIELCDCHHHDWQTPHFESPHSCNHDHSVEVKLYDIAKRHCADMEPIALYTSQLDDIQTLEASVLTLRTARYARDIPLHLSPTLLGCGLRAPPAAA